MNVKRLEGKVALITGSTSGIGRATAKLLAAEGAHVVITGRRVDWGESALGEMKSAGGTAVYFQADLADSQAVRDLVRFTISSYGRLDVLMNNAYSHQEASLLDMTEANWDRYMAVMLKAPFIACQEAMPQMLRQGRASIINVSSVQG
jgi:NAD(P)-dependent dehydrogenase (short-subunit alcohol dehydrogenase family)